MLDLHPIPEATTAPTQTVAPRSDDPVIQAMLLGWLADGRDRRRTHGELKRKVETKTARAQGLTADAGPLCSINSKRWDSSKSGRPSGR